MPIHDHLDDCFRRPELRSVDHSRVYVEPDYMANDCDVQLPMVSAIGKGERGNGVVVKVDGDGIGGFSFKLLDEETGEVVLQSPDLSAPEVSVRPVVHRPTAGEAVPIIFRTERGRDVAEYTVTIPAGSTGSLIYLYDGVVEASIDGTYRLDVDDLTVYGKSAFPSKPDPRQNDVVFFRYREGLAFGTIEAVENGSAVFTCRTMIPWPKISVSRSGDVLIDGEDVGVNIMGPKGDEGRQGDPGKPAIMLIGDVSSASKPSADVHLSNAAKNEYTIDLKLQRGEKGLKGDKGKDPKLVVGNVSEMSQPMANVRMVNAEKNEYAIDFGFPRGADGMSVSINGGIYKIEDLPSFDDTPVNDAFIVDDGDGRYDLYIRAIDPVIAGEGGPWTVVDDWQGIQGFSMRRLKAPHKLSDAPLEFSKDELEDYLVPTKEVLDGDLVVDDDLCLGVVSSAFDQSGTYVVTRVSSGVVDFLERIESKTNDFFKQMTTRQDEHEAKVDGKLSAQDVDIANAKKQMTTRQDEHEEKVDGKLSAVEAKADEAKTAASAASTAAGKAEDDARAANAAAEKNAKAIKGKQDALTAGANVSIDGTTISATDTTYGEATTAKAGLMSAADKVKLDGLATGETVPKKAEAAGKLASARTVAISGAVNGSTTWDGSDDLTITVTVDPAAAGFLAAHPVGFYAETSGADPNDYGGTWERALSVGPHTWLRTK